MGAAHELPYLPERVLGGTVVFCPISVQAAENCKSHVTNTYPWPTALKRNFQQQTEALIQVSSLGYVWFFTVSLASL